MSKRHGLRHAGGNSGVAADCKAACFGERRRAQRRLIIRDACAGDVGRNNLNALESILGVEGHVGKRVASGICHEHKFGFRVIAHRSVHRNRGSLAGGRVAANACLAGRNCSDDPVGRTWRGDPRGSSGVDEGDLVAIEIRVDIVARGIRDQDVHEGIERYRAEVCFRSAGARITTVATPGGQAQCGEALVKSADESYLARTVVEIRVSKRARNRIDRSSRRAAGSAESKVRRSVLHRAFIAGGICLHIGSDRFAGRGRQPVGEGKRVYDTVDRECAVKIDTIGTHDPGNNNRSSESRVNAMSSLRGDVRIDSIPIRTGSCL